MLLLFFFKVFIGSHRRHSDFFASQNFTAILFTFGVFFSRFSSIASSWIRVAGRYDEKEREKREKMTKMRKKKEKRKKNVHAGALLNYLHI